jgi:uncharacterized protein YndB with AHSA1/START domain
VISSHKDVEKLTLTFVAEFPATVERLWQVWADPRQLERWYGPPEWPATFEKFEFEVGGEGRYYMTGPDGAKSRGWMQITTIEPPHRLEYDDAFADDKGQPVGQKMHSVVTLESIGAGARMTAVTRFVDLAHLEEALKMGFDEGWVAALAQINDILASDGGK